MKSEELLETIVFKALEAAVVKFLIQNPEIESSKEKTAQWKIKIEYSRSEKFGDYSTAFLLENKENLGKKPEEIADEFISCFNNNELFKSIEFTKPGFINFRIQENYLIDYIAKTIMKGEYAEHFKKEKIIFEFVSANPTGPLNIVSARAAATGDAICNLLEKMGHEVHREFYVNDYGNQVYLLGISCLARLRESLGETLLFEEENSGLDIEKILSGNYIPFEGYRGEYLEHISEKIYSDPEKKKFIDENLKNKSYSLLAEKFSAWTVEENLSGQKSDLSNFGVEFDKFYSEKSLHDSGDVLNVMKDLEKSGDISSDNGKKLFLSTKYGDDKDRVVLREDGRPTYLLADIAYHKTKITRGFNKIINIWGPDHHGYITRLSGAMISLGLPKDSFKVLIAQQVNMVSKGEKLKMSKRLGQFQTMNDLESYLGTSFRDVARYFFLMRSIDSPLDFDLDLAKEESDKNPVFYVQYAQARICSIFRETGDKINISELKNIEWTEERRSLLFWVARFPDEIFDAGKSMEPHRLINYMSNLSKAFTKFYINKNNKLKEKEGKEKAGLAYLCRAVQISIKNSLSALGISAPEKMERNENEI